MITPGQIARAQAPSRTRMQMPAHLEEMATKHRQRLAAFRSAAVVDRHQVAELIRRANQMEDIRAAERFKALVDQHDAAVRRLEKLRKEISEHVRRPMMGDISFIKELAAFAASTDAEPVTANSLEGPSRKSNIVAARFAAMRVCKKLWPGLSTTEIGWRFGGRDHSSVVHALRPVKDRRKEARIKFIQDLVLQEVIEGSSDG